jgi:hypothetical protein
VETKTRDVHSLGRSGDIERVQNIGGLLKIVFLKLALVAAFPEPFQSAAAK